MEILVVIRYSLFACPPQSGAAAARLYAVRAPNAPASCFRKKAQGQGMGGVYGVIRYSSFVRGRLLESL